jgi:tRNA (guanine-N7-)-methyltransferase
MGVVSSHPPYARSFRPRRRGLPPERAAAYERRAPLWSLEVEGEVVDLDRVFGPGSAVVLDIGFGGGEGVIEMAASHPQQCIIGIEVHTPGVAKVLEAIEEHGWRHVRIVEGDALDFLPRLAEESLTAVRVWFPDPWLKNKQQHRRLVRPSVVAALTDRLRVGGTLHVATDIVEYARHTEKVIAGEPRLSGGVVPRPEWRPFTRFERRGHVAGRAPVDLMYERIS